jgi:carbon-monoxide dehydrogenase small subunit
MVSPGGWKRANVLKLLASSRWLLVATLVVVEVCSQELEAGFFMKKELIELKVNGRSHELAIEPSALLLDVLRQDLELTGSKRGCDESSCGACTVLVDGVAMMSCTLLAASCQEQEITTIEGVSEHGSLAAIQKAYGDWGGAQCGFCTPGFIMTVKSLLAENPDPSESEVRMALSSNLCRCTGYSQMYEAIRSAIAAEQQAVPNPE